MRNILFEKETTMGSLPLETPLMKIVKGSNIPITTEPVFEMPKRILEIEINDVLYRYELEWDDIKYKCDVNDGIPTMKVLSEKTRKWRKVVPLETRKDRQ